MSSGHGWFADRADHTHGAPSGAPWVAFVQVAGCCHPLDGVWFTSEADCWTFIHDELVGLPALPQ